MKPRTAALIALTILAGLTAERLIHAFYAAKPLEQRPEAEHRAAVPTPRSAQLPSSENAAASLSGMRNEIETLLKKLQRGDATKLDLAELERQLKSANAQAAIAAILGFLETGQDANVADEFTVGEGGQLAGAPTLRVKLMDLLGQLSKRAGTGDAAAFARRVLASKSSPDEWAISLRNVAWREPHDTKYLVGKLNEMLTDPQWLSNPSAGMLEAFDVAVFARDPSILPTLAAFGSGETPALQRAAAVAFDRLSEASPLEVMNYLNGDPALIADRPFVRADYFAKADLSQFPQRQAVETYLSRSDVSLPEKSKFLKALITPASFVSDNLLTAPVPPSDESIRMNAVAQVTREWLSSGRFPDLQAELLKIQSRLNR